MHLQISKSLFSILILTIGASILVLLRPDLSLPENKGVEIVDTNQITVQQADTQKRDAQSQISDLNNIWIRDGELKLFLQKRSYRLHK